MKKIGIIGLGIMSRGMALNFLKNNYEVFVWNRTISVAEGIEGAIVCDTPKSVTEKADVIFEVTANDESSEEVWTGDAGIIAGADSDKTLIISSTVSIEWTNRLINLCNTNELELLDIPLTGGRVGAETGNLTLLCGGNESTINNLEPIFKAIAGKVMYFGPQSHGMKYKLILNYLQGAHMVAFGQALKLAEAAGMDSKKVAKELVDRPGGVATTIAEKAYFEEKVPKTFSIEWITKDLRYAQAFAEELGLDLSILKGALETYNKTVKDHRDEDWASVNRIVFQKKD